MSSAHEYMAKKEAVPGHRTPAAAAHESGAVRLPDQLGVSANPKQYGTPQHINDRLIELNTMPPDQSAPLPVAKKRDLSDKAWDDAYVTDDAGFTNMQSLNQLQHGGDHYMKLAIHPAYYIMKNKLPWAEGSAIKYLTRHRDKGGAEDIRKAIHFGMMILEDTYGETYEQGNKK
jgi:hypothetical protein